MKTTSDTDRNFTAVVHAADGVRFVASAPSSAALAKEVVGYIANRCDDSLWPSVAAQVREFIDDGKPYAAIATYFANVGQRWDAERLELDTLSEAESQPNDLSRDVCQSEHIVIPPVAHSRLDPDLRDRGLELIHTEVPKAL